MQLRSYQIEALERLRDNPKFLLADDMGLGKTATAISSVAEAGSFPCVVVCPASVKVNWSREVEAWSGKTTHIISGRSVYPLPVAHFYVINYDILSSWAKHLLKLKPEAIVFDECHYMRNATSRGRASVTLGSKIPRVLFLSGTPMINGAVDLYNYLTVIDPQRFPNKKSFCETHCKRRLNPWTRRMEFYGVKDSQALNLLLGNYMMRRRKEDVLAELPSKNRISFYMHAEEQSITLREGCNRDEAKEVFSRLMLQSAQQKLPQVISFVEDYLQTGKKILLGVHHLAIANALMSHFGKAAVLINGTVTAEARQQAADRFNNDPKCKVLVGNIRAAGEGINLQKSCSTVAFVEFPLTASAVMQFEDRVFRMGQRENVNIYFFTGAGTIDEHIVRILLRKCRMVNGVIEGDHSSSITELMKALGSTNDKPSDCH